MVEIKKETYIIMRKFKKMKPYRGTLEERKQKFKWLNKELSKLYNIPIPKLIFENNYSYIFSGYSYYNSATHTICLYGRLSIITYLHEFAHALGYGEEEARNFSQTIFKTTFPILWSKLKEVDGLMIKIK